MKIKMNRTALTGRELTPMALEKIVANINRSGLALSACLGVKNIGKPMIDVRRVRS